MGVLFEDKQQADEYAKEKQEEGYTTKISRSHYGIHKELYYEVILTNKRRVPQNIKKLVEQGIPSQNIITYYVDEHPESANFAIVMKPEVKVEGKRIPAYILASHEIAHHKLQHKETEDMLSSERIEREKEAWAKTAEQLKRNGEWEDSKEYAIAALATYYDYQDKDKAREFIESL